MRDNLIQIVSVSAAVVLFPLLICLVCCEYSSRQETVISKDWSRKIVIGEIRSRHVKGSSWRPPYGARNVHHYEEFDGIDFVEHKDSRGNVYTVPVARFSDRWTYDFEEPEQTREVVAAGSSTEPLWPDYTLAKRGKEYNVDDEVVMDKDDEYTMVLRDSLGNLRTINVSEDEYMKYDVNMKLLIHLNFFGGELSHGGLEE